MGRISARARTAVDLAVPFSPRIRTPDRVGLIRLRYRASFICSWPTMATKGYMAIQLIGSSLTEREYVVDSASTGVQLAVALQWNYPFHCSGRADCTIVERSFAL
ncbi:MAG: hypothetical protein D3920_16970 [Candidatus Electrothrix sp. AW2]|nr:hypothetical protein [Candidatus Electrothrix gigas]